MMHKDNNTINTELFRSRVDTIVLSMLSEKDRYGYEILEVIVKSSVSHYEIKQSTLYSILRRLENSALIESYDGVETNGAKRKYYKLTEKGKKHLSKEQFEWEYTRTLLDRLVSDKPVDLMATTPPFDAKELKPMTPRNSPTNVKDNININDSKKINYVSDNATGNDNYYNTENNLDNFSSADDITVKEKSSSDYRANLVENQSNDTSFNDALEENAPDNKLTIEESLERERAQQLLGIGKYVNYEYKTEDDFQAIGENSIPTLSDVGSSQNYNSIDYREALGTLFSASTAEEYQSLDSSDEAKFIVEESIRYTHYNDMKQTLSDEGYLVKTYNKANSINFFYMNYIYSNKIYKDLSILSTSLLLVMLLSFGIIFKNFSLPFWIAFGTALFFPLTRIIAYKLNPTRRIRAKFKIINVIMCTFILLALNVSLIFAVNYINNNMLGNKIYFSFLLFLIIPFTSATYYLLFRSNKYHLKK